MGLAPQGRHFPARNRIVAGLSRAVVVVEAATRSGSLITARAALEAGREVLAVPGHPFDARAGGCNVLIRDGATLVRGAQDVLDLVGRITSEEPAPPAAPKEAPQGVDDDLSARILDRLCTAPLAEDQLLRDLGLPAARVSQALVDLELSGRVGRQPGGLLVRHDLERTAG